MPLYIYLTFITLAVFTLYGIRLFVQYQAYIPTILFIEGLNEENNGRYEEALISYQSALVKLSRIGGRGKIKKRIIEKERLMHTIIKYESSRHYIR